MPHPVSARLGGGGGGEVIFDYRKLCFVVIAYVHVAMWLLP